ncbi:hypothetical protein EJA01_08400 [Rhodovulum iodosum]|uniref:hypothetical protein n=1 Tax=Rhodovulum iodosum TaxID=68291 RepID=UPI000F68C786|nr:hypothetical protein [Rhodovulum robiginosum]RSK34138.1 hypothetical protein EJA01_08400 [Rhodovulum robiginosum]
MPNSRPGRQARKRALARLGFGLVLATHLSVPATAGARPPQLATEIARLVLADDWVEVEGELSDAVETARLKAGILCVSWARDMIDQHWHLIDRSEGAGSWPPERQNLWRQIGWVDAFETQYLRPRIDADSQAALRAAWWPEGVATRATSDAAREMHRFCMSLPGLLGSIDPYSPYFDYVMASQ